MRRAITTAIGLLLLGLIGSGEAEAVNIQVREVSREAGAEGLDLVYELRNASVDRWDLRRVEVHLFDERGRRLEVLRPPTTASRLEREDVEFIRTRVSPAFVPQAHHLEIRVFVQEVLGFPVADPSPTRLVYPFPLRRETAPRLLPGSKALRVEPAGMVQWGEGPRTIQLRVVNRGQQPVTDVVLLVEITGDEGSLNKLRIPVTPAWLSPGKEAYVPVTIAEAIARRATDVTLRALYGTPDAKNVRFVEDLEVRPGRRDQSPEGILRSVKWRAG